MTKTLANIITDKNLVTDKNTYHAYIDHFYESEFAKYKDKELTIIEIGIDQGGSLMLWAEYFSNATIFGLDLQMGGNCGTDCAKYKNINIRLMDAYQPNIVPLVPDADIIVDDGPHTLESQVFAVEYYLPKVRSGGIFIIEDIPEYAWIEKMMEKVPKELLSYVEVVDLRQIKNRYDDLMFVVRVP